MKIDLSKGGYGFQFEEKDLNYNLAANNIIHAKEVYLKHISGMIDEAIDDSLWRLSQLEK
jgi:hypothetical protein